MRVLVTNDDGIDSAGLQALAAVAVQAGLDVVVAAPHAEQSGSSAAMSALEAGGRLILHPRTLEGLADVHAIGVEASPAMIAFVAVRGAFGPAPELVLSGVNHGPNTGHAVLHSGTVGAALTAARHGRRALAVSMAAAAPRHWATASEVARRALAWVLAHGEDGTVLNVNVPDLPLDRLRGLRQAGLATYGMGQAEVGEVGEGYVTMRFSEALSGPEAGSDTALLSQGWATATALRAPCEATDVDLSRLG